MKIEIIYMPDGDRERAALKLLNIQNIEGNQSHSTFGEPERQHRILGALIDILQKSIIP